MNRVSDKTQTRKWMQVQVNQEEYSDTVGASRHMLRKARTHPELNLTQDIKGTNGFCKDLSSKVRLAKIWVRC